MKIVCEVGKFPNCVLLSAKKAPYRIRNEAAVNMLKTADCNLRVFQKT